MIFRTTCALLACLAAAYPQETSGIQILGDTALTGETYRKVEVAGARVRACEDLCEEDDGCAAFTVAPKPGRTGWTCELKREAGEHRTGQRGFTSGTKGIGPNDPHPLPRARQAKPIEEERRQGLPHEVAQLVRERFEGRGGNGAEILIRPIVTPPAEIKPDADGAPVAPLEPPGPVARTTDTPPSFAGEWIATASEKVVVTQAGAVITFRDSANRSIDGRLTGRTVKVDGWGAEAELDAAGRELRWSNGLVWTRAKATAEAVQ